MYPDELTVVAVYYMTQAFLIAPVCLLAETNMSAWKLTNPLNILLILNSVRLRVCLKRLLTTLKSVFKHLESRFKQARELL